MNDWSPVLGLPLWVWLFVCPSLLALGALVAGPALGGLLRPIWRVLDGVYLAAGVVAAGFMVTILALIVAQMIARWTGTPLPGTTSFAGYAMAATSFFALAHTLTRGAHIRVSILLNANDFTRRWLDLFAVFMGAVIATYFARFAIKGNVFSEMLNDRTQGQDQIPAWVERAFALDFEGMETAEGLVYTPLWIPQLAMSIGTVLLALCLWDILIRMCVTRETQIVSEAVE